MEKAEDEEEGESRFGGCVVGEVSVRSFDWRLSLQLSGRLLAASRDYR